MKHPIEISQTKMSFFFLKTEDKKETHVLSGICYDWEEGGYKERV
jgi:hypothetical protein